MSAANPRPNLELPPDPSEIAFRAIESILREDPILSGVVRTWRSREGFDDDLQMPAADLCPAFYLSPAPEPDDKETSDTALVRMVILVEVYTRGSCIEDQLRLWGAVRRALARDKPFRGVSVREFLRCGLMPDVSIPDYFVKNPAFTGWVPSMARGKGAGQGGVSYGLGSIRFSFQRPR